MRYSLKSYILLTVLSGFLFASTSLYAKEKKDLSNSAKTKIWKKIKKYKTQIDKKKANKKIHLKIGKLYMEVEEYDLALQHLKESNDPPEESTLLLIAEVLDAKKDYIEEIRALEILVQLNPRHIAGWTRLGNAYYKAEKVDEAISKYRTSIKLNVKYKKAHLGLLKAYQKQKNNYETRIILLDLQKLFGSDGEVLNELCHLYTDDRFFENGITYCQKAIEVTPNHPDNHIHLATNYVLTKKEKQARKILTWAAKKFPKSELAQYTLGSNSFDLKNWEHAAKYFNRCVKAEKNSWRCHIGLAESYFEMKKYDKSLKHFSFACSLKEPTRVKLLNRASELRINRVYNWYKKFDKVHEKCKF